MFRRWERKGRSGNQGFNCHPQEIDFFALLTRSLVWFLWFRGILVIATPYASGFDHLFIADEVQFKFDRCLRFLQETVSFNI